MDMDMAVDVNVNETTESLHHFVSVHRFASALIITCCGKVSRSHYSPHVNERVSSREPNAGHIAVCIEFIFIYCPLAAIACNRLHCECEFAMNLHSIQFHFYIVCDAVFERRLAARPAWCDLTDDWKWFEQNQLKLECIRLLQIELIQRNSIQLSQQKQKRFNFSIFAIHYLVSAPIILCHSLTHTHTPIVETIPNTDSIDKTPK